MVSDRLGLLVTVRSPDCSGAEAKILLSTLIFK